MRDPGNEVAAMYLQQIQQKKFFFRFLVKFFTLSSFMHSAFQDLRRYSRVPVFTISGVVVCIKHRGV